MTTDTGVPIWVPPDADVEGYFWDFAAMRQEAFYRRRVLGLPQSEWYLPYNDPVVSSARFTNVYRMLDRNTQFCVEEILESPAHTEYWHLIAHSMTFRWFNRIETYQAIRPLITEAAHGSDLHLRAIGILLDRMVDNKQKVFTGAYMSGVKPRDAPTKGAGYAMMLGDLYGSLSNLEQLVLSDLGRMRQCHSFLTQIEGIGGFIAYQMVLDLMYPLVRMGGRPVGEHIKHDWAHAGPGCIKGLALMGVKGPDQTMQRAMRHLHDRHVEQLHGRGFRWIRDKAGVAVPLALSDVENCLCEYQKYVRMMGGGHTKTKWSPLPAGSWEAAAVTIPWYGDWAEPWRDFAKRSRWGEEAEA